MLKEKISFKGMLCVLLSFCVVLAVFMPFTKMFASAADSPSKMLYIKTAVADDLIQRAKVEVGETYYLTFGLSNTIKNFNVICRTDSQRRNMDANIQQVEKVDKGGSTIYTYSYTIPEKDKQGKAMTDLVFFGIKPAAGSEGYFFDVSIYNSKDAAKTELFTNPDFSGGLLNGWCWGWTWLKSSLSSDKTTLEVVDYDEALLGIEGGSEAQPKTKNYYVKNGGTGDGRTETAPAATVYDVMTAVNADLGEGDTANIYIMQREDYKLIADVDGTKYNQMTAWSANGEILPEHKAAIVVQPYSKDVTTHLSFTNTPVTDKDLVIAGPTTFKNITFVSNKKYDAGIVTNKHSVIFGDGVNYLYTNTNPDNYWFATGVTSLSTALAKDIGESAYTEKIDIVFENKFISKELNTTSFVIGSGNYAIQAFSEDVNITFNNASAQPRIVWGNLVSNGGETVFGKNLNINIKSAASVTNAQGDRPVTVTGGIQFIVNSATAVSGDISDFTNITATSGKWYITNASTYTDLISFTDTAGPYSVKEGHMAVATNESGDKTYSADGVLTLSEGKYTVTDYIQPDDPTQKKDKMLYFKGLTTGPLIQRASVTVGETYYFAFSLTSGVNDFTVACYTDGLRREIDANVKQISKVSEDGYNNYVYSFTIPEKDKQGNAMTSFVFFGIKFSVGSEGYFFDASLYNANNTDKTEMFENPDFSYGVLDQWAWGWAIWFNSSNNKGLSEWTKDSTTLKVVDYDKSLFGAVNGSDNPLQKKDRMLYFKSPATGPLMQRASVEVGATYHFAFSLTSGVENFKVVCFTDGLRREVDANIKQISKENKNGYNNYVYSFTIPEKDKQGNAMTSFVFFGIKFSVGSEGYFFDASLYNANNTDKTEMFENPDFSYGVLDQWAWGWAIWFNSSNNKGLSEWTKDSTTLKVVDYDENLFSELNNFTKKMIYFNNGATSAHFASLVDVVPGGEYCMTVSGYISHGQFGLWVRTNGARSTIDVEDETLVEETVGNCTTYTYTFTLPENLDGTQVFIGPSISSYNEGYIYDMELYKTDDDEKLNLWGNPTFKVGLDSWTWGWAAWFGVISEKGLTYWSEGLNTVEVMDFDVSKIDKLVALNNINDGEWWDKDDLIEDAEIKATFKGTLVDQNGKPISNAKLILISENSSYTKTTNSKGEFEFSNLLEGFYELYVVDLSGNEIPTGFYTNFYNGDTVKLNLVCDSTNAHVENSDSTDSELTINSGSINGTVYTPNLKTVENLKIYMRGVGEVVTDKNGSFTFADVPVGDYDLYTILADGSEYEFRTITVKENVQLSVKLKYDVASSVSGGGDNSFNWIWIVVTCSAVLLIAAVTVVFVIIKKKKAVKI